MSSRMAVGNIPGKPRDGATGAGTRASTNATTQKTALRYPLVPSVIGGHNFSLQRPQMDKITGCVVLASDKCLFYYDIKTGRRVTTIYPNLSLRDTTTNEHLVWCERHRQTLYVCSNTGRLGLWHLEQREWIHHAQFPVQHATETVIAFKLISPTKFVYSVRSSSKVDKAILFTTHSRSIREPFRKRQAVRTGSFKTNAFDVGNLDVDGGAPDTSTANGDVRFRRYIVSCIGHKLRIHETFATGRDPDDHEKRRSSQHFIPTTEFTCVRANPKLQMVAAGDTIGRIFLYQDDLLAARPTRTTLHWHQLPINDLCYSATGNMLFSVGGETGAVVCWELSRHMIGQKLVITRLGMPIHHLNYSSATNQLISCHTDNTVQIFQPDMNTEVGCVRNFTRGQIHGNVKHLTYNFGIRWHSATDSVVANELPGVLQFYSPHREEPVYLLDLLQLNPPSYEREYDVYQSDITQLALSPDGKWLALIESFQTDSKGLLPQVRLKIWALSDDDDKDDEHNEEHAEEQTPTDHNGLEASGNQQWKWIMTEDRPHQGHGVKDLRFSDNSKYLVSVGDDHKFRIWYRVSMSAKATNNTSINNNVVCATGNDSVDMDGTTSTPSKQRERIIFARGFIGNMEGQLLLKACFTEDSSLLALAVNNSTIALWTIESGLKLHYETQLGSEMSPANATSSSPTTNHLIDMAFGHDQCAHMLCDVRSNKVNVWSILDPNYKWEYNLNDPDSTSDETIIAAAFDQGEDLSENNFVLITSNNNVLLFNLDNLGQEPLMKLELGSFAKVTHAMFVANPISPRLRDLIESSRVRNSAILETLSRLCMLNAQGELLCFDDKLKLQQYKAQVNFDRLDSITVSDLGQFLKMSTSNGLDDDDINTDVEMAQEDDDDLSDSSLTDRQSNVIKRIKLDTRPDVHLELDRLFDSMASHTLPPMDEMACLILETFVKKKTDTHNDLVPNCDEI